MLEKSPPNKSLNRWIDRESQTLGPADLLLYRSNLLGSDLAVTNFGGGNTSAKIEARDPLTGESVEVLWVKGSGGDLGSMAMNGFATLYMEKLLGLEARYRGSAHEDEMVAYLPHCTYDLNPRAASIDTPLHAYLPYPHIDHTHPDAVIAIAASRDSESRTVNAFDGTVGWLDWQRPGFDLGLKLRDYNAAHPGLKGVVLAGHGLISWGETSQTCYLNTIEIIERAQAFIDEQSKTRISFGGAAVSSYDDHSRRSAAAKLMPTIRDVICAVGHKVGHFDDRAHILEFVNSKDCERLADIGTSCPDHFLRTKIRPLMIDFDQFTKLGVDYVVALLKDYQRGYGDYYERCKRPGSPAMRDANPIIFLVPGIGMISFAKDKSTARIASEFYTNAINVMRGAEALGGYQGLPEQEAFDIEYWALEEAKLKRMPPPRAFEGRIAFITGGAGAIGRATAQHLLDQGACVMLSDIDEAALAAAKESLANAHGDDRIRAVICDVTNEHAVTEAFEKTVLAFGGLDILVANAGIATAAPIEDTSLDLWRQNFAVLTEGYFLVSRQAFPLMKGLGGAIVFVASKNALVASPNASAYATAKSAELHLARCLALEGAAHGIRVNSVNPDAILSQSKIWSSDWRRDRALAYGLKDEELEAHYRDRSLLKRTVEPADVAEAIVFLTSDAASKSTGNILNVDAGHAAAFPR